jgi:hypothetical protein
VCCRRSRAARAHTCARARNRQARRSAARDDSRAAFSARARVSRRAIAAHAWADAARRVGLRCGGERGGGGGGLTRNAEDMASMSSGLRRGHMWSVELVGLMMSFHMLFLSPLTAMETLPAPAGRKRFSRSWWTWWAAESVEEKRFVEGAVSPEQSHPRHVRTL